MAELPTTTLPPLELTKEQYREIVTLVETWGERRLAEQRHVFNECDFLTGAMAAFMAVGMKDWCPASWIFGPMAGRSVIGPDRTRWEDLDDALKVVCDKLSMARGCTYDEDQEDRLYQIDRAIDDVRRDFAQLVKLVKADEAAEE